MQTAVDNHLFFMVDDCPVNAYWSATLAGLRRICADGDRLSKPLIEVFS